MARGLLALGLLLAALPARAGELEAADAAVRELRYPDARATLDRLLKTGHLSREQLIAVYALAAEVAAVLDGPEAGEREYRRLLVLDPGRDKPRRDTPVFVVPFERARRWVANGGALALEHPAPAQLPAGVPAELRVRVASDPLAMLWALRARVRQPDGSFQDAADGRGTRVSLPPLPPGTVEYYLQALDERQNVVFELGSPEAPYRVPVLAAPARPMPAHRRLWRPALGLGVVAVASLAAAIGLDVTAAGEFGRLQDTCAPTCSAGQLDTFHLERGFAAASYALAGAAGAAAIVLLIVDRVHARR